MQEQEKAVTKQVEGQEVVPVEVPIMKQEQQEELTLEEQQDLSEI